MKTLEEIQTMKNKMLDAFHKAADNGEHQLSLECLGASEALMWVCGTNENLACSLISNVNKTQSSRMGSI